MKPRKFISMFLVLSLVLLAGCASEITAPVEPTVLKGTITPVPDSFMATIGDATSGYYMVYTPPAYNANRAEGYPVLYMLHGFGGNENYYVALFSATDAADWLLANGLIEPMILVFPSGHNALGGSFYTNSPHPAVSNSEGHILSIIDDIDNNYNTADGPGGRAICGHSMGGYGALSITMNNPDMFGAVSIEAGPISFWGTMPDPTYKGIEELLPSILIETGYDTILAANPAGVQAAYKQMMYPSPERKLTSMMFAMAAAFSPSNPFAPVATTIDSIYKLDDQGNPYKSPLWVDLPIGINGAIEPVTWSRWMAYDCVARFASGQAANLANVKIALDAGVQDDLGLQHAHEVFAGAMQAAGMAPTMMETFPDISDSEGNTIPADHTTHTFERIKKLIAWHSAQF